ncbi:MAG: hypothetical protein JJU34_10155 [Lunatimonas sp.]|uniref:hypothetical protein n=1 Tax=Lunatimonas sp. TaxID=2060141 RepID=UPI00263B3AE8|nr:hypothetical protein [Lunatimonas sp.]MCC5937635.1 hypothetical protein [Lunatimonas sp.]
MRGLRPFGLIVGFATGFLIRHNEGEKSKFISFASWRLCVNLFFPGTTNGYVEDFRANALGWLL